MPLFAVIGLDHPPPTRREAARPAHRAYVKANDALIRLASAMFDSDGGQCGSLYVFEAEDEGQVRDWLAKEPFVNAEVYKDLVVREIRIAHQLLPQMDWNG